MSIRLSARVSSDPTERISMKFSIIINCKHRLFESDHLEDLGIDGAMIVKLRKCVSL
jgi:hypothetical protein